MAGICVIQECLTRRYFANGSRMPAVADVADRTLYKDAAVAKAFSKNLSSYVVQPYSFACWAAEKEKTRTKKGGNL